MALSNCWSLFAATPIISGLSSPGSLVHREASLTKASSCCWSIATPPFPQIVGFTSSLTWSFSTKSFTFSVSDISSWDAFRPVIRTSSSSPKLKTSVVSVTKFLIVKSGSMKPSIPARSSNSTRDSPSEIDMARFQQFGSRRKAEEDICRGGVSSVDDGRGKFSMEIRYNICYFDPLWTCLSRHPFSAYS